MATALAAPTPGKTWLDRLTDQRDIFMAIGVIGILVVLILPMPRMALDMLLAISIAVSVMVLFTALFIEHPLQFSSFPTVLLLATMLRLALNLASTRLILAHGHEGPDAAGHVIQAFGGFVMQGNVVIGLIVFAILVIVNFVVITKGSGRIAEVAARFSLDAMPGKQMAIDADLSAGLIDEDTARTRRKTLEEESSFFGAMDGAAKFVRGDAIAGLLITAINLIAGLIIGIGQMGISASDAAQSYTLLTVGDGLVSQIPALIVSTAAGLLVSKAGVGGRVDNALVKQFGAHPRTFQVTAGLLVILGLLPGLPIFPFFTLAAISTAIAWYGRKGQPDDDAQAKDQSPNGAGAPAAGASPASEDSIGSALAMDTLRLELGYGLLQLIKAGDAPGLPDQVKALRRQLAKELGFLMPAVRIQDNLQLPANTYVIRLKEMEVARGEVKPTQLLVMDPQGLPIDLVGEATKEPTFGLDAMWIGRHLKDAADAKGLTIVEPTTVVTTHLTELVKENLPDLLSFAATQQLLSELAEPYQRLLSDLVPSKLTTNGIQRVLQGLLSERVSVRDLPLIMEALSDVAGLTQNHTLMIEYVRGRLARQISRDATSHAGYIPILTLSPAWEQAFADALVEPSPGGERQLAMAPSELHRFVAAVRDRFEEQAQKGELPVLVTTPTLRPYVRAMIERFRAATVVLSQNEIHPKARIKTLGQV
ncbi:MAG: flagellar biosynthesis protein FlhA [Geminicoccaceae bacterium]|nr:MAG: flagellar biosynthesis protein FlhA [Geminicoccaceae bacterium]